MKQVTVDIRLSSVPKIEHLFLAAENRELRAQRGIKRRLRASREKEE
jgi:hypothetical protein